MAGFGTDPPAAEPTWLSSMLDEIVMASGGLGAGAGVVAAGFGTVTCAACPVCTLGSLSTVCGAIGAGISGLPGWGVGGLYVPGPVTVVATVAVSADTGSITLGGPTKLL